MAATGWVTTLTDHRADPADRLIRLYHERWEIESAYLAIKDTMLTGAVLRSGDPVGVEQELWATLTLYQALRRVMTDAVETRPGTDPDPDPDPDPDRACFTTALETARDQVITAHAIIPGPDGHGSPGAIGQAVLATLLPRRRARTAIRKVKSPISRYHTHRADDRPPGSIKITDIEFAIRQGRTAPTPPEPDQDRPWALERHLADTARPTTPAGKPRDNRKEHLLAILHTQPGRAWHARELGQLLNVSDPHSFTVQLSQWARKGLLRRTGRGIYALPLTNHDTP
jgi:hypothetical protein